MKRSSIFLALVVLLLVASGALADFNSDAGFAQSYEISWWTVDGGGDMLSTTGDYTLSGTAGQPDAGLLTGGDYALGGGFWGGGELAWDYPIYLPLVLRNF